MALTTEELQRAIASYQGSNAPMPLTDVPQPAMVAPPPQAAPVQTPSPVVEQALPPSAPETYQLPTPQVTNSTGALREMDAGTQGQLQAEEHKAVAQTLANDEQGKLIAQQNAVEAAAQAENQKKVEEGRQRVAAIYDQAKAIDSEADKIQVKDKRTTTQKVLGILGLALAGVADGLSGFSGKQTNFAGELDKSLSAAVDKDLAMQREAINDKRKQSAAKYSEMGIAQKLFVDDVESATKYATALRKDMYARELDAAAKRSQNPVIQAEGAATAAKILQDNAKEKAQLLTSKENARIAAAAASQRIEQTAATAYRPGAQSVAVLEAKEKDKTITGDEQQELDRIRQNKKTLEKETTGSGSGKLSEAQIKAVSLYEGAQADMARIREAVKTGNLPGWQAAKGSQNPLVPDALLPKEAETYRSARAGVNDILRNESGASISPAEKDELLAGLSSTDETVRKQTYQRILDKYDAMGRIGKPQNPQGIQAGGKVVKAEVAPDAGAPVQFNLGGKIGSIPADQVEAFQKKYPSAKRVE